MRRCRLAVTARLSWLACPLLWAFLVMPALACEPEVEPNDAPPSATVIPLDEACAKGASANGEADWLRFDVQEAGLWRLRLEAPPDRSGAVTLGRVPAAGGSPRLFWRGDLDTSQGLVESPSLLLDPGVWHIAVAAAFEPMRWRLFLDPAEALPPAQPAFENAFSATVAGAASDIERNWTITTEPGAGLWTIALRAPPDQRVRLALTGPAGRVFDNAGLDTTGGHMRIDLALRPGDYRLRLQGLSEGAPAILSTMQVAGTGHGFAAEPDEAPASAFPLVPGTAVSGHLYAPDGTTDTDRFSFSAAGGAERAIFFMDLPSLAVATAVLADASGAAISDPRQLRGRGLLGPFDLDAGSYVLKLSGDLGPTDQCFLELRRAPPRGSDEEAEPNDRPAFASRVTAGASLRGDGSDGSADFVAIEGPEREVTWWTIRARSDRDLYMRMFFADDDLFPEARKVPEEDLVLSRFPLVPGPNLLKIAGAGSWNLTMEPAVPPEALDEREPNDHPIRATTLDPDESYRFALDRPGDEDRFELSTEVTQRVALEITAPTASRATVQVVNAYLEAPIPLTVEDDPAAPGMSRASWSGTLPPGATQFVIKGQKADPGQGTIRASLAPPFAPPEGPDAVVRRLDPAVDIRAGEERAQRVRVDEAITVPSLAASALRAEPWVSRRDWRIVGLPETPAVPDSDLRLGFHVEAPPDVPDGALTDWAVALVDPEDGQTVALVSGAVRARSSAPVRDPVVYSPLPSGFEGALNAAMPALGAAIRPDGARLLVDGIEDGEGVKLPVGQPVEIDLAGEDTLPILGLALTPAAPFDPRSALTHYRVETSDGGAFVTAFEGEMEPTALRQYVVFDPPRSARTIRFVPLETRAGASAREAVLSGLAVLTPATSLPGQIDIARRDLGGHLISTTPTTVTVVGDAGEWPGVAVRFAGPSGARADWVLGFQGARAASIARVDIDYSGQIPAQGRAASVQISGTLEGPNGPWTDLGTVSISPDEAQGSLVLDAPRMARALRFVVEGPDASAAYLPLSVAVWEHRDLPGMPTILGERGPGGGAAGTDARGDDAAPVGMDGGPARDTATILPAGAIAGGRLDQGTDGAWYQLRPSDMARSIVLDLSGEGMVPELTDAAGTIVPLQREGSAFRANLAGLSLPLFVHLTRPRESLVVVWDTSGSVVEFEAAIFAAILDIAGAGRDGRLSMNFVPFRAAYRDGTGEPLMAEFTTSAGEAQSALNRFVLSDESSDAESALMVAARALAREPGRHHIILITDASFTSSLSARSWAELGSASARVHALQVPSGAAARKSASQINMMQDWAGFTGGSWRPFSEPADARAAFQALSQEIDRPLPFQLSWTEESVARTARLRVLNGTISRAEGADAPGRNGSAVVIVLDASGSMLQRIDGIRRIEIAKSVLARFLQDLPPDGPEVGVRLFGTGGRGACNSSVLLPISPVDPAQASVALDTVKAVNGARTPIGASLEAAAQDLAGRSGRQTIILITDGEETCGGAPRAAILALREAGLDVRLNIVGLDLSDADLVATYRDWADLGGGQYMDATDVEGLLSALSSATALRFSLLDAAGELVAEGVAGSFEADLPEGTYRLLLDGAAAGVTVELRAEEPAVVVLSGSRASSLRRAPSAPR